MRKSIYFSGVCALAAAAIFVWLQNALVSSRANTASASLLPHQSALEAAAAIAPATLPDQKIHDMAFVFSHGD
jgi:hypothetical protein